MYIVQYIVERICLSFQASKAQTRSTPSCGRIKTGTILFFNGKVLYCTFVSIIEETTS